MHHGVRMDSNIKNCTVFRCVLIIILVSASIVTYGNAGANPILISDAYVARPFYGIGAISGGGATGRLLFDYAEPHRSQVLDLLFATQKGANLQHQKVEIAADADTTCGSECAHRIDIGDSGAFDRGYEWWYLTEAKKRNPSIFTSALQWAAPGFVSDPAVDNGKSLFTQTNIDYVLQWIYGLSTVYNITLDYMAAGWNEHPYNATYVKMLRQALDSHGYSSTRVTASDEWDPNSCWNPIYDLINDPTLADAIDVISVHVAGELEHNDPTPAVGVALGIPIFQGEEHIGLPDPDPVPNYDWAAAGSIGIEINENWILNNMSATIYWPDIYSWYSGIAYRGKGLMTATSPWGNGTFYVPPTLWIVAHTTHFTDARSWFLLNESSSGHVPATDRNVSYVTYVGSESEYTTNSVHNSSFVASNTRPFTIVIESLFEGPYHSSSVYFDPVTITFQLGGTLLNWVGSSLNVWHTNQTITFEQETPIVIQNDGTFTLTIEPAAIYTLTTVASSHPGARKYLASLGPHAIMVHGNGLMERPSTGEILEYNLRDGPMDDPFPIPHMDDFEGYLNDTLPLYTSDMFGAFTVYNVTQNTDYSQNSPVPLRYMYQNNSRYSSSIICSAGHTPSFSIPRCTPSSLLPVSLTSSTNNHVLRQYTRQSPIGWSTQSSNMATIIGNYTLQGIQLNVSVLIEQPTWPVNTTGQEFVYLGLRGGSGIQGNDGPSFAYSSKVNAYTWTMNVQGVWTLMNEGTVLQQGIYNSTNFTYNTWYSLSFIDLSSTNTLQGYLNNILIFNVTVPTILIRNHGGYIILGSGCNRAQYDNLVLDWSE